MRQIVASAEKMYVDPSALRRRDGHPWLREGLVPGPSFWYQATMQVTASADPIVRLLEAGEHVPDSLRSELLALGSTIIPPLIELLEDEEAALEDSTGDGWGPIHAVGLLVDLKAEEAIEPLLRTLAESGIDDIIYSRITIRLPELGAPVLEQALSLMGEDIDEDVRGALYSIISELGIRDERIFEHLCEYFEKERALGAMCFAEYGDERALQLIRGAIEEFEPDWDSDVAILDLNEFVDSYERIAGALPAELMDYVGELRSEWELRVAQRIAATMPALSNKIGRNEPCPCGSGKKYKKCCQGAQS